jgi:hypothetical protein
MIIVARWKVAIKWLVLKRIICVVLAKPGFNLFLGFLLGKG